MAKVHKIHSLPDDAPWDRGVPPVGSSEHPLMVKGLDRVLAIQRPFVLATAGKLTLSVADVRIARSETSHARCDIAAADF